MAEGLIHQSDYNGQMEDQGKHYFHDLLSRSLFQQSNSQNSKFVMHDLVNDMAQWIAGETSFLLDGQLQIDKQSRTFDKVRHSSYICGYYDDKYKLEVFHKLERTRTFLPILFNFNWHEGTRRYINNLALLDLLPKLKRLRALSLKAYFVIELPSSIGCLGHMRYLNLSRTMIKCLPESASSLFNLQTLLLREYRHLMKLPSNMRNLINLRHIDISGENLIEEMPVGMEDLKFLQTLSNFIVGKGSRTGLKDLKSLKCLRGELCISGLENVTDSQDVRGALLSDMKNLEILFLEWGSEFDHSRNEVVEKNVLDWLQPHRNLKELKIKGYGGIVLSAWIGDPSLSNMVVIRLENCKKCSVLPLLGLLCSLKDLTIKGMRELRSIGSEFYGDGNLKSFQSLETLRFEDLPEWEHWDPVEENDHAERFPCLRELSVEYCPKISKILPGRLSSLEKLVIRGCSELEVSDSSVSRLSDLIIDACKRTTCSSPTELQLLKHMTLSNISDYGNWLRQAFPNVISLRVGGCKDMTHLWENEKSVEKQHKGFIASPP